MYNFQILLVLSNNIEKVLNIIIISNMIKFFFHLFQCKYSLSNIVKDFLKIWYIFYVANNRFRFVSTSIVTDQAFVLV